MKKAQAEATDFPNDPSLNTKETYLIQISCKNCGTHHTNVKIPKGVLGDQFISQYLKCPNCGCKTLEHFRS